MTATEQVAHLRIDDTDDAPLKMRRAVESPLRQLEYDEQIGRLHSAAFEVESIGWDFLQSMAKRRAGPEALENFREAALDVVAELNRLIEAVDGLLCMGDP